MIELELDVLEKSKNIIVIGYLLDIFPNELLERVEEVKNNLERNELFASDLIDLHKLCINLIENERIGLFIRMDIIYLIHELSLKVREFAYLPKPCTKYINTFMI